MQFSQELDTGAYVIRSCTAGEVVVSEPLTAETIMGWDQTHAGSAKLLPRRTLSRSSIVTPQRLVTEWPPRSVSELTRAHLDVAIALGPEIVLLGTGTQLRWPTVELISHLHERGIGFEIMATAAACRTYNILMFEGRRVAAALLIE